MRESLMKCPRCGFPTPKEPCELCGQADFTEYELAKYNGELPGRFELTLTFPDREAFGEVKRMAVAPLAMRVSAEFRPRVFVFFQNEQVNEIHRFLTAVKAQRGWTLFVNGRPRPYTEELWLPFLELLNS